MVAAASALESDTIRLEKHKLARVQQLERRWLESALGAELESPGAAVGRVTLFLKMEKGMLVLWFMRLGCFQHCRITNDLNYVVCNSFLTLVECRCSRAVYCVLCF